MKLNSFIQNSIKQYGHHKEFLQWLGNCEQKVRIYQPIEIQNTQQNLYKDQENLGLFATKDIAQNQDIMLVSTQKCITGLELVGCDRMKSFEINQIVQKVASKYYPNNLNQLYYTQNILKIIVQLFVHLQDEHQVLHHYSSFLKSRATTNPLYWDKQTLAGIYDSHLASLIASTKNQMESIYVDLQEEKLFGIDYQFFIQLMSIVRSRNLNFVPEQPKYFDLNSVAILCPLVDLMNHDFDPNCKIEGRYHQHETDSYVAVKAIKDIREGEELKLDYGHFHNYDFLMRYGFVNKVNQHNEMPIALEFNDFLEYTAQLFEMKQKLFRSIPDFSLDKFVIYSNKINQDLIAVLRIYFLSEQDLNRNFKVAQYTFKDFKNQISLENEILICEFMIHALKEELEKCEKIKRSTLDIKMLKKQNNSELIDLDSLSDLDEIQDLNYRNMFHMCVEKENMLKNNQNFFKKKLQSLL